VPVLGRILKEKQADIIHNHSQFPAVAILFARCLLGWKTPILHNTHNHVVVMETSTANRVKHCLEIYALKHADFLMVDTDSARQRLHQVFGISPGKVFVRPEGLDFEEIDNFIKSNPARVKVEKGKIVLYPALIIPRKNQIGLIRAVPKILEKHPYTKFVFPGPVADRDYYQTLQREVAERKLSEHIAFIGELPRVPDLFRWYLKADVFVFPTFHEMQGATLLEAMAFGLPCAASGIGPITDIAGSDNSAVLLFDPDEPDSIAQAITRLLDDEGLCRKLSVNGKTLARHYGWDSIAQEMLGQYRTILYETAGKRGKIAPAEVEAGR
jgi:glycosyltransferase involved in cell wall biosynthesis